MGGKFFETLHELQYFYVALHICLTVWLGIKLWIRSHFFFKQNFKYVVPFPQAFYIALEKSSIIQISDPVCEILPFLVLFSLIPRIPFFALLCYALGKCIQSADSSPVRKHFILRLLC